MRYSSTPAGMLADALGLSEPDPVQIEARARQIKAEVEDSRHATYANQEWSLSTSAAKVIAAGETRAEATFTGDSADLITALSRKFPWLGCSYGPDLEVTAGRERLGAQMAVVTARREA